MNNQLPCRYGVGRAGLSGKRCGSPKEEENEGRTSIQRLALLHRCQHQLSMFPDRIDVHSHFLPDFYRDALHATGHGNPDGMPAVPVRIFKPLVSVECIIDLSFDRDDRSGQSKRISRSTQPSASRNRI
jgi:hypothetical protein